MVFLKDKYKIIWIFVIFFYPLYGIRHYDKKDLLALREEVREMFQHAYDSYLKYAYPYDELRPLSCDGVDTWGSYSLTLIDALDTLAVMGNHTEFQRVVNILTTNANFDANINVSVFETNIRIIGGLLSAHLLSHRAGVELEPGWPCNGPLLRLAEDVARRLIVAFDTKTHMPYGTVNLRYGVPIGETTVTCTAGVGTFILEFGTLSRLTGDPVFEEVAMNALYALHNHRSSIGLLGNHIDIATGRWTAQDAGIGAGVDSYYEYLVKGSILFQKPELMEMFNEARKPIDKYMTRDDWHMWVSMSKGQVTLPVFQSLEAYWPGVLSLIGDTSKAMKSIHNYHQVWKQYGFTPEFFNIPQGEAGSQRESYPLRPELIESVMYLYRATGNPYLLEVGVDILRSIQHSSRTPCGYATIKDVRDHRKEDRMESFFLSETTKYLYLLFDTENFIHNRGQHGTIINTPHGECVIDAGGYIFNTEAHPIDPAALHCCHDLPNENLANIKYYRGKLKILEGESLEKLKQTTDTTSSNSTKIDDESSEDKMEDEETITEEIIAEEKSFEGTVEVVRLGEHELEDDKQISSQSTTDLTTSSETQNGNEKESVANNTLRNLNTSLNEETNNFMQIIPEFVQKYITPVSKKFDAKMFLERIRFENKYPKNSSWEINYSLLSCRAQPYLQRISLLGEFFD
ncbi:ER degradation-enhancing alpha-mannosidase-like protein 2 [Chrysoperla carnea]|uniref:ER degradation-enhancing alpha-mannosidase-like protein 2 n=1 Tax=Chrysoperla carnea TaxID=189513 RepID=UPI001D077F02|nr:ER degradation-enhancing alpha-mannosidase-like protein 2 [Chrysoperla carnea]